MEREDTSVSDLAAKLKHNFSYKASNINASVTNKHYWAVFLFGG